MALETAKHEEWCDHSSSSVSDAESFNSDFSDDEHRWVNDRDLNPPCTLPLEYWKRSPQVQDAKDKHIDMLDDEWESREARIFATTLRDEDIVLEANMFPYDCPEGIRHFTLWSLHELSHSEICKFVVAYCHKNTPNVVEWNYEENSHRSIDIPHVHVFLKFSQEEVAPTSAPSASTKRKLEAVEAEPKAKTPKSSEGSPAKRACIKQLVNQESTPCMSEVPVPSDAPLSSSA